MELEYSTLLELMSSKKYKTEQIKTAYFSLLSMLTTAPDISNSVFLKNVFRISNMGDIIVAHHFDIEKQELIIAGTGTVLYEPKIIRGGSYAGHIEDIVVHENYRKKGIAKTIIDVLIERSKEKNCYKIILDCKPELENFYTNLGFYNHGLQMRLG